VPGDLRRNRVEDRLAADPERLEGAEELVAAAVAAADRAEPGVAGAVLSHPAEVADQPHQAAYVLALDVRVLDVRVAAGVAPPALVEREDAVARVEKLAHVTRVGAAGAAPAVAVHQQGDGVSRRRACRPEQRVADPDPGLRARFGGALHAVVDNVHLRRRRERRFGN
jgi:hypothetical protein